MSSSDLPQDVKNKIDAIYTECAVAPFGRTDCESSLDSLAQSISPSILLGNVNAYTKQIKEYFCTKFPGVKFCRTFRVPNNTTTSVPPPPPVPPGPPPMTPEQFEEIQRKQIEAQQQQIPVITTPSGFIGQNPGISIGAVVFLFTAFCCCAAFALSFLTAKNQKPPVVESKRGGRGRNQPKRSSSGGRQKKRTSSSMSRVEKGKKKTTGGDGKESKKEEKPSKSSLSKSKGKSGNSAD